MYFNCDICNTTKYIRPSHYKRTKKHFCSSKCAAIGQSGLNNHMYKDGKYSIFIPKICVICGEEFYAHESHTKTCSRGCYIILVSGKNNAKYQDIIKNCIQCHTEFKSIKGKSNHRFCCMECKNTHHSKQMSGDGNPRWLGGISNGEYGIEFNEDLKLFIRNRDNHACRLCGLVNEDNIENYRGSLPIHHIDYNKSNNNPLNLITLCNSCHAKTNSNREQWKIKLQTLQLKLYEN